MKRLFPILFALFVLSACSKMDVCINSCEVSVILNDGTKASFDLDGKAGNVNRCKMQILLGDKMISERIVATQLKGGVVTADFKNITLSRGENYTFLFWADKVSDPTTAQGLATDNFYNTADLRSVTVDNTAYSGNDDSRDAFCKCVSDIGADTFKYTIILRRPFAQLNVIATDVRAFHNEVGETLFNYMFPTRFGIAFTAPTKFNVESGKATESKPFVSKDLTVYGTYVDSLGLQTLTMDYILAPAGEVALTDIVWSAEKPVSPITRTFTNIPLQRNYRTNIMGGLLTNTGNFNVSINPGWYEPDYYYNYN